MPTSFPAALDSLPRPGASSQMNVDPYRGSVVIDNISDAIEAIQAKLGIGASAAAANQILRGTGAGASAFGALAAGDIAAGLISTTMLAANAVTQIVNATPTTASPTTTSTTAADIPQMTVTYTATAGSTVLVLFSGGFYHNTAGGITGFTLNHGGSGIVTRGYTESQVNYLNIITFFWPISIGSTGSVTTKMQWQVSSGQATANGVERGLTVIEFKR